MTVAEGARRVSASRVDRFAAPAASSFAAMQRNQRSPGSDTMRLRRVRLVSCAVRPGPRKETGRLRRMFLASGAPITGLCQRRFGCRPLEIQLVPVSTEQSACCEATFVPAQQPGTVGWPRNMAGLYAQRQQAGAEFVVTRCRVSGNPLPVLHPKEVLRNHGFLSAFFVSFGARQKTPARGRNNSSCPEARNQTPRQIII